MSFLALIPPIYFNVKQYGAIGDGITDDTTAILTAITQAAGGTVFFPAGTYKFSAQLALSTAGTTLLGVGGATLLQPTSSFAAANLIPITADFCAVRDLVIAYANTSYSANPAADGIQISGARSVRLRNVELRYINGWGVQSSATASIANYWCELMTVRTYQCAQGIHILGNSGSSYNMGHFLTDCNCDQVQAGDGLFIEDAHDVVCANLFGTVTAGSGSSLHIKGASAATYISTFDLGPSPGPSTGPVILIESGTNGSPKQIALQGGIVVGGTPGITVSAGTQIKLLGLDLVNNGTHGINLSGAADGIIIDGCTFIQNGSTAGSGHYDFQSSTSGHVVVTNCQFMTAQGTLTQQTSSAVNVTAGTVLVENNTFSGSGYTSANIFAGFPKYVRNNPGYNPLGSITAPTIGSSPYTDGFKSSDFTVFVSGGTVSAIAIGGTSTGLTSGTFRLPAGQSITLTFTVTPSWKWIGD